MVYSADVTGIQATQPAVSAMPGQAQQRAFLTAPKDTFTRTSAATDGKFSAKEAGKNFLKGLVSPITTMFSSSKNFLIGLGTIAAGAGLLVATGGAAAPLLLAVGVGFAGLQLGKGGYKLATAKNGDEREQAFNEIGAGTGGLALSAIGAKSSLKATGAAPETLGNTSVVGAAWQNLRQVPASFRNSLQALRYDGLSNLAHTARSFAPFKPKTLQQEVTVAPPPVPESRMHPVTKTLAEKYRGEFPAADKQAHQLFGGQGRITGRTKSLDSINTKILTTEEEGMVIATIDDGIRRITDGNGHRLVLKNGSAAEVSQASRSLAEAAKRGDVEILEVRNYQGKGVKPYFSGDDMQLLHETNALLGKKPIDVQSRPPKPSGYTGTHVIVKDKNGVVSEIQIRGPKLNKLSEIEHLLYDMRSGKPLSGQHSPAITRNMEQMAATLRSLDEEQYALYMAHLTEHYQRARLIESGVKNISAAPALPEKLAQFPYLDLQHVARVHKHMHGQTIRQQVKPGMTHIGGNMAYGVSPFIPQGNS